MKRLLVCLILFGCAHRPQLVTVPECPPDQITLPPSDINCFCESTDVMIMSREQAEVFVPWVTAWKECAKARGRVIEEINRMAE